MKIDFYSPKFSYNLKNLDKKPVTGVMERNPLQPTDVFFKGIYSYCYPQISFSGNKISPDEIEKCKERHRKAKEEYDKLPLIIQYACNPEDKKITLGLLAYARIIRKNNTLDKNTENIYLKILYEKIKSIDNVMEYSDANVINDCLNNYPFLAHPKKLDQIIDRAAVSLSPEAREAAICNVKYHTDPVKRDVIIEKFLFVSVNPYEHEAAINNIQYHSDPKFRDEILEKKFPDTYCSNNIKSVQLNNIKFHSNPKKRNKILEKALKSVSEFIKVTALNNIQYHSKPKKRDKILEKALKSQSEHICSAAIRNIQYHSDPKKLDEVFEKFAGSPISSVQVALIKNIKYYSDPKKRDKLLENVLKGNSSVAKGEVIENIQYHSDPKFIIRNIEKALRSRVANVVNAAINNIQYIPDPKKRDEMLEKILNDNSSFGRKEAIKNIQHLSNPNRRAEILLKLSKNNDLKKEANNALLLEAREYMNFVEGLAENNNINGVELVTMLYLLSLTGRDGAKLGRVLQDYNKFVAKSVNRVEKFPSSVGTMTQDELRKYFDDNKLTIIKGIILGGKEILDVKFEEKQEKFEKFLKIIEKVSDNDDVFITLYEVLNLPANKDGEKLKNYEKVRLIEIANNFLTCTNENLLLRKLRKTKEAGYVDYKALSSDFIRYLARSLEILDDEIAQIPPSRWEKIDNDYKHLIQSAMNTLEDDYRENLKGLLKATLKNNYYDYIFNPETDAGKANAQTRKMFEENGLDYDKWLNYNEPYEFKYNGKTYEIDLWKRNPGHDLFMGTYGKGCISLDGVNRQGIIDALMNTLTQFAEIKEKSSNKTVGYARCYWARREEDNEKVLIIDNIHYKYDRVDKNADELVKPVSKFMKDYAKAVSGNEVDTYLASCCNLIFNKKEISMPVKVIGKTPNNTYYLNSVEENEWSYISDAVVADVYKL